MVVTLARQQLESDYLDVHQNSSEESAIEEVGGYSPGIAGVRLARGIRLGKQLIDRRDVLKASVEKMQATDAEEYDKVISGRTVDLICVAASKVEFLRPLFSSEKVVKEPAKMQESMAKLIDFVNKQSAGQIPLSLISSLGLFSHELLKNTQEHARTNHLGKDYLAHVEGLILGWTRFDSEIFSSDFSGNENLRSYWEREANETESGKSSLRAFQISFFDSGPGFVSRFTGRQVTEMTLEEERKFLIQCLQHKASSKPENAAGEGLPAVLGELRKVGGLMRIRSGRLSLFNVFSPGELERDIFAFEDWTQSLLSPVEGAVVSIIVPLRRG